MLRVLISPLRAFVFSNFFIAICAVAMCWQTVYLFQLREAKELLPFVFFSTMASYSFHWYLSMDTAGDRSRENWLKRYRPLHMALLIAGIAGLLYFGMGLLAWWPWLLLTAFATFLYSAPKLPWPIFRWLRKVALGKTFFLAAVWVHVTTILPLLMSDQQWTAAFSLFVLSRFFLIYAICIIFDLRDRENDRRMGIRSLITWLNIAQIRILFSFSIFVCIITTVLLGLFHFGIGQVLVLLLPGLLTALSYPLASRHFSDLLYYAWLDGLMALSAFLFFLANLIK